MVFLLTKASLKIPLGLASRWWEAMNKSMMYSSSDWSIMIMIIPFLLMALFTRIGYLAGIAYLQNYWQYWLIIASANMIIGLVCILARWIMIRRKLKMRGDSL